MFSSKDMCMIEHIPELVNAGIDSFKIEGRVKSAYYTAVTANAYKTELLRYMENPDSYVFDNDFMRELTCVSHREYGTGYFFDEPEEMHRLPVTAVTSRTRHLLRRLKVMMKAQRELLLFRETKPSTVMSASLFHPV